MAGPFSPTMAGAFSLTTAGPFSPTMAGAFSFTTAGTLTASATPLEEEAYCFLSFDTLGILLDLGAVWFAEIRTLAIRTFVYKSQTIRGVQLIEIVLANDWYRTFCLDTCQKNNGIAYSHVRT